MAPVRPLGRHHTGRTGTKFTTVFVVKFRLLPEMYSYFQLSPPLPWALRSPA